MTLPFLDTNVLVYAFGADQRSAVAQHLLEQGGRIAVQSLNEFIRVVVGKQRWSWHDALRALDEIESLCEPPIPMAFIVAFPGPCQAVVHVLCMCASVLPICLYRESATYININIFRGYKKRKWWLKRHICCFRAGNLAHIYCLLEFFCTYIFKAGGLLLTLTDIAPRFRICKIERISEYKTL